MLCPLTAHSSTECGPLSVLDEIVLCVTLQRKRRESASSSSSVKKVKKPWWEREYQLTYGGGQREWRCYKFCVWTGDTRGEQDTMLSIYVETPRTTRTHRHSFAATDWTSTTPPHLVCPPSHWQRQRLSDISFHYCSSPCFHQSSALDEARSTVNCQAELIGTWGRRLEWLGNWNELEWKNRLLEWEDLKLQCSFDPYEVFFVA